MTQLEEEPFVRFEGINLVKSRYKMYLIIISPPVVFLLITLLLIKIEKLYLWSEKMT